MAFVESGSTKLYVKSTAEGSPIVVVHEFASDLRE